MSPTHNTENSNNELTVVVFAGHRTEKLADPLSQTGEDVTIVSNTSSSLLRRAARTARVGQRELRQQDVDIVVGDHAGVVSFVAALLSAIFGVPFVLRLGGNIWGINREKLREHASNRDYRGFAIIGVLILMNRTTFSLCSGYLAISQTVEQAIIENTGVDSRRIGRIGVPLDYETFVTASPTTPVSVSDGGQLLVTVTNLRFRKKYEALRDALPNIRQVLMEHEDIQYVIAGDGVYLELLHEDINTVFPNGIRNRVHCVGFVDDVEELYAAADAMVYVSYAEGFGNIVQEAMAAGCPVVANDKEGLGEQIEDDETGFLVDSPSDSALSKRIEHALYDPKRSQIVDNAREYVRSESDAELVGKGIVIELRTLLDAFER